MQVKNTHVQKKVLWGAFFCFFIPLAFLWSVQSPLIPSANHEIVAFVVYTIFFIFISRSVKRININKNSFLVLFGVFFISLIHLNSGLIRFNSDLILILICCLYFFLVFNLIASLKFSYKKDAAEIVFLSLLISALVTALIIFYQWMGFANSSDGMNIWVLPATSSRLSGNLAQPNHAATLLIIGVVCLYYFLHKYSRLPILFLFLFLVALFFLIFALFLTYSRTAIVSLIVLFVLFVLKFRRSNIFVIIIACLPLCFYLLINEFFPFWKDFGGLEFSSVPDRGVSSGRYLIWIMAFEQIKNSPLVGYGVFNNIETFLKIIPEKTDYSEGSVLSSAHNIFFDLAIWFGVPFSLLMMFFYFSMILRLIKKKEGAVLSCAFFCIIAIMNHATLEYPLNYFYFSIPFVFLLGIVNKVEISAININLKNVFFGVCLFCFFIIFDYYRIELNFKKVRLESLGYKLSSPYNLPDYCILDSYCSFVDLNSKIIRGEYLDPDVLEKVALRFPTPVIYMEYIKKQSEIKNDLRVEELKATYNLIFRENRN